MTGENNMAYKLTNGTREESSESTEYDDLLAEAESWAACSDTDVSVIDLTDGQVMFTVNHLTGLTN